ncbi:MAG: aminopeptidase N [Hyphomonadaceae bacterium]|nr:aminopeptidase N [Hyphomonadaceae bacterium]
MRTETPVQIKLSDYAPYPFAIDQVEMVFDLALAATKVHTKMAVRRLSEGPLQLDGVQLKLDEIRLNGAKLRDDSYELGEETLTLSDVPDTFTLETIVTIDPSANTALSGLYISGDRFCTQCESVGFRRITFWPDRPDVMSRFKVRLEADQDKYPVLLSNGTPGDSGALDNGRHFAEWDDPHLKPSYLFALCAGDYDIYRDTFTTMGGAEVDLAVHVDKGDGDRAAWAMESLKASMKWDEEVFAREYDLGVFNIVAVRDFNFGAMENKGLNIFNSAYVLADEATATDADFEAIESIVGHEYFHNWTGNRITCRDWFQLCLKEGLTVFRDQEFSADMRSRPVQRIKDVIRLRARQFAEDAGPLAHQVRPDSYASIDNLYTATVYEKGAELIRMLKTLIGDETFANGMQIYFDRHDGEATTIEHFYACFEEASGEDLANFRRWYSQPGTPTVSATEIWDEDSGTLTVMLSQSNPKTPGNDAPTALPMPIRAAAFAPNGDKVEELTLILDSDELVWRVSGQTARPLVSLNRGFSAPIRLDHQIDDAQVLALAQLDDDPFNQWNSLQSLVKKDILAIAYDQKSGPDADVVSAIAAAVRANAGDPAFAALLTRLPDIGELFLEHVPADPTALSDARKQVQRALATELSGDAATILAEASPAPFKPDAVQSGTRALRSAMLTLLGALGESSDPSLLDVFESAENMTESLSALRALATADGPSKASCLSAFADKWSSNPLVMDKWFAVQAATGDVADIELLIQHADFDLSNPNRVRSVIAVFAMQNLAAFHVPDGSGYRLVTEVIEKADEKNPALAARLLTAFEQWKSLEPRARAEAEIALKALREKDLSENASDIITRTLG